MDLLFDVLDRPLYFYSFFMIVENIHSSLISNEISGLSRQYKFPENPFSFSINTALFTHADKSSPPPQHRRHPPTCVQGMSSIVFTALISENGICIYKGGIQLPHHRL